MARIQRTTIAGGCLIAAVILLAVGAWVASCEQRLPSTIDPPMTFRVELVVGDPGRADQPLPFGDGEHSFVFDISAIDEDGSLADWFDRQVHLAVHPVGQLGADQTQWVPFAGGVASGVAVTVENIHGSGTIWFEDTGSPEEPGSYATGLSPTIYVEDPTIRQVQQTELHITSALEGDFVQINLDEREAVVTGITRNGFFVTDLTEPGYVYSGIFVYSFSRPRDTEIGHRIVQLSGIDDEFYGFTELGFPSWKIDGELPLPEPVVITGAIVGDDETMEQYESGLVEVQDVTVCPVGAAFEQFGQWAVLIDPAGDCTSGEGAINVLSAFTVPEFDPAEHEGAELSRISGNLRFHTSAMPNWIIQTRFPDDIAAGGDGG